MLTDEVDYVIGATGSGPAAVVPIEGEGGGHTITPSQGSPALDCC